MLMLRPHGDTFTALDQSGYRLMSYAFSQGRGLHEVDQTLMEVPFEIRNSLLLVPYDSTRNTRDRSFKIKSLETGESEPFFYPLIPLVASGLESLFEGYGRDLLMPLFGLIFCLSLMRLGVISGGSMGLLTAMVFCLGSPLPLWLFRGFNLGAAGATLLVLSVCTWWENPNRLFLIGLFAGLAAVIHPVYIVIGPLWIAFILLLTEVPRKSSIWGLCGLAFGLLLLIGMTLGMAAPYGTFRLAKIASDLKISVAHQLMLGGLLITVLLLGFGFFSTTLPLRFRKVIENPQRRILVSLFCLLPMFLSLLLWSQRVILLTGLWEFWLAIRWPMGALIALGIWQIHALKSVPKSFGIWMLFLITLPLFMYLKGAEQMGMWSQRRLFPSYTLLALALIPVLSVLLKKVLNQNPSRIKTTVACIFLGACALSNFIRWPAPYLLQVEKGALAEIEPIKKAIGNRLVFFDYHPYSFPFAVDNKFRILGLGEESSSKLAPIAEWMSEQAKNEQVLWVTGYSNPGLEQGQKLVPEQTFSFDVDRLRAKASLPAKAYTSNISMHVLKADVSQMDAKDLRVDKIFDGGPLALRPPWGMIKRTVRVNDEKYPADWSRQGSGIIGPIPLPGDSVKLTFWAKSGQSKPQIIHVLPPWGRDAFDVEIPVTFQKTVLVIPTYLDTVLEAFTGTYRLSSPTPYDPGTQNIHGFPQDLGALFHQISIERVPRTDLIGN